MIQCRNPLHVRVSALDHENCRYGWHETRGGSGFRSGPPVGLAVYASAVIEILRFRLPPGTDEAAFLAADRRVQDEFASHQPGLLRRTTARGEDGSWIVIDLWRSAADADACDARWAHDPVSQAFMALLDQSTITVERYHDVGQ
jgi:hypothetical protein